MRRGQNECALVRRTGGQGGQRMWMWRGQAGSSDWDCGARADPSSPPAAICRLLWPDRAAIMPSGGTVAFAEGGGGHKKPDSPPPRLQASPCAQSTWRRC